MNSSSPDPQPAAEAAKTPSDPPPAASGAVAGAASGAASGAAVGAATGALAGGPIGAAVGAAVGAIAGGMAGRMAGGMIDRKQADAFWRERFRTLPYAEPGQTFEEYEAAFHAGYQMYERDPRGEKSAAEWERELRELYEGDEAALRLKWERTIEAARDAYLHLQRERSRPLSPESKAATPAASVAERQITAERDGEAPD